MRGYALCGEQRTGSNYLCALLASTKVLGRPLDYFYAPDVRRYDPDYPDDPGEQLGRIVSDGATANGVYGLKIFSDTADRVEYTRWYAKLPDLHFVHLVREDLLEQAISSVRAFQTRQYWADAPSVGDPVYDPLHIASEMRRLAVGQARWATFFTGMGIRPLRLSYEEVSADPARAVRAVGSLLDLECTPVADPSATRYAVQRDALSSEWRARFLDDPTPVFGHAAAAPEPSLISRVVRRVRQAVDRRSSPRAVR